MAASSTQKKNTPTGPLSNKERQRRYRQRHKAALKKMRALLPSLRVTEASSRPSVVTRNAPSRLAVTEESIDDRLTQRRQRLDQIVAEYLADLDSPRLTNAEVQTVCAWFLTAKRTIDAKAKTTRRRLPEGIGQKSSKVTPIRKGGK